jgi:hypothetical protein
MPNKENIQEGAEGGGGGVLKIGKAIGVVKWSK